MTLTMSSIINLSEKEFSKDFKTFAKDMNFIPKKCKPHSPETKSKDESCNRFMNWLYPYQNEFETEEDLIKIIEEINLKVNKQINETIGIPPIMLFQKEKLTNSLFMRDCKLFATTLFIFFSTTI